MALLSIIVPIYNEEGHLNDVLPMLFNAPCPPEIAREWILVDDCSTDASRKIIESFEKQYPMKAIYLEKNKGKGAAVRIGIEQAKGDLIMIQDADFEYDPNDVPSLLQPFIEGRADVVYGSRFKPNATQVHRTYHYYVNRFLTISSNLLSGIHLTDMETCYKIFRADLLKAMNLKSNRFGIEIELTAYVAKTKARIFELPIHYYPRTYLQGKKITWRDGVAALAHLVRYNWGVKSEQAFTNLPQRLISGSPHAAPMRSLLPVN